MVSFESAGSPSVPFGVGGLSWLMEAVFGGMCSWLPCRIKYLWGMSPASLGGFWVSFTSEGMSPVSFGGGLVGVLCRCVDLVGLVRTCVGRSLFLCAPGRVQT